MPNQFFLKRSKLAVTGLYYRINLKCITGSFMNNARQYETFINYVRFFRGKEDGRGVGGKQVKVSSVTFPYQIISSSTK